MDVRMAALIRAIEARYPGARAVVKPWADPEGDRDIRWWVWVLQVRDEDLGPLDEFAYRLAGDLYGPDPVPFCLASVGKRRSKKFLADREAREKREEARPRRVVSSPRGVRGRRPTRRAKARAV